MKAKPDLIRIIALLLFAAITAGLFSSCARLEGIGDHSSENESAEAPDTSEIETAPIETEPVDTEEPPHSDHVYVNGSCTECGASEGLKYKLNGDGTATLYSDASCTAEKVTVAAYYNGCPVTDIGNGTFKDNPYLCEIVIPETVTNIGSQAFLSNTKLEKVTILGNLAYIGDQAFYNCTDLLSIDLPDSVEYIGEFAFFNCSSITEFRVPTSLNVLLNNTFYLCFALRKLTMHQGMTGIGASCFASCDALNEIVDFPNDLDYIEHEAFPESAPIRTAYGNCIYIGGNDKPYQILEKISPEKAYHTVEIHPDTKAIAPMAFYRSSLQSIDIHENIEYIGYSAFGGCKRLETVTMSDNVTILGQKAFLDCSVLTSIRLSDGIKNLETETFRDCIALNQINMPSQLETIATHCFDKCKSLTELHFPKTVKSIDFGNFDFVPLEKIFYEGTQAEWEAINVTVTQYPGVTLIATDGNIQY